MRTTITFDDDVAAAVKQLRRATSRGVSEVVNDLVRAGLRERKDRQPFVQQTEDMGMKLDVTNIGETLELLEGPYRR